jgi:hypothetical protein
VVAADNFKGCCNCLGLVTKKVSQRGRTAAFPVFPVEFAREHGHAAGVAWCCTTCDNIRKNKDARAKSDVLTHLNSRKGVMRWQHELAMTLCQLASASQGAAAGDDDAAVVSSFTFGIASASSVLVILPQAIGARYRILVKPPRPGQPHFEWGLDNNDASQVPLGLSGEGSRSGWYRPAVLCYFTSTLCPGKDKRCHGRTKMCPAGTIVVLDFVPAGHNVSYRDKIGGQRVNFTHFRRCPRDDNCRDNAVGSLCWSQSQVCGVRCYASPLSPRHQPAMDDERRNDEDRLAAERTAEDPRNGWGWPALAGGLRSWRVESSLQAAATSTPRIASSIPCQSRCARSSTSRAKPPAARR